MPQIQAHWALTFFRQMPLLPCHPVTLYPNSALIHPAPASSVDSHLKKENPTENIPLLSGHSFHQAEMHTVLEYLYLCIYWNHIHEGCISFCEDLWLLESICFGHLGDRLHGFLPCYDEVWVYLWIWLSEVVLIHCSSLKFSGNIRKRERETWY